MSTRRLRDKQPWQDFTAEGTTLDGAPAIALAGPTRRVILPAASVAQLAQRLAGWLRENYPCPGDRHNPRLRGWEDMPCELCNDRGYVVPE